MNIFPRKVPEIKAAHAKTNKCFLYISEAKLIGRTSGLKLQGHPTSFLSPKQNTITKQPTDYQNDRKHKKRLKISQQ